jgi:hypothetical protein
MLIPWFSVYTGMGTDAYALLGTLVASLPVDKLRFLTFERRRAYATILWTLLGHRRSHEIEVYYADLMIEAMAIVPAIEPGNYTPDTFRGDVKQLEDARSNATGCCSWDASWTRRSCRVPTHQHGTPDVGSSRRRWLRLCSAAAGCSWDDS